MHGVFDPRERRERYGDTESAIFEIAHGPEESR